MKKALIMLICVSVFALLLLAGCSHTHNYELKDEKTPTCSSAGYISYVCSGCGDIKYETVPATGDHLFTEEITVKPLCDEAGEKTFTCSVCGYSYKETVPATGEEHAYEGRITTEPTCGKEGVQTFTCRKCGKNYTEPVPATGEHDYGEEVTKAPTCSTEGEKTFTCKSCGYSYKEAVPTDKDAHVYNKETYGFIRNIRLPESEWYTDDYGYLIKIKTEKVSFSGGTVTTYPTCTEEGVYTVTCTLCGESHTETIPTVSHDYKEASKSEPTCTDDGLLTEQCSVCGDTVMSTLKATGHTWVNATCTAPKTCSKCGETSGSALGHTTDNGKCTRCGQMQSKPIEYKGTGDKVITGVNLPAGTFYVETTYSGANGWFKVEFYYGPDKYDHSTISMFDRPYAGSHNLHFTKGEAVKDGILQITAAGAWTITFKMVTETCTTNIKGSGDVITGMIYIKSPRQIVSLTCTDTDGLFDVEIYKIGGDYYDYEKLAYAYGEYSGQKTVTLDVGYYYISVLTQGTWTIDFGLGDPVTEYKNKTPSASGSGSGSGSSNKKWTYDDAMNLFNYADKADDYALKAAEYANKGIAAKTDLEKKTAYNGICTYLPNTLAYLNQMKRLADSKESLALTNSSFKTYQEMLNDTINMFNRIVNDYATYDKYEPNRIKASDDILDLSARILTLMKLAASLLGYNPN